MKVTNIARIESLVILCVIQIVRDSLFIHQQHLADSCSFSAAVAKKRFTGIGPDITLNALLTACFRLNLPASGLFHAATLSTIMLLTEFGQAIDVKEKALLALVTELYQKEVPPPNKRFCMRPTNAEISDIIKSALSAKDLK